MELHPSEICANHVFLITLPLSFPILSLTSLFLFPSFLLKRKKKMILIYPHFDRINSDDRSQKESGVYTTESRHAFKDSNLTKYLYISSNQKKGEEKSPKPKRRTSEEKKVLLQKFYNNFTWSRRSFMGILSSPSEG